MHSNSGRRPRSGGSGEQAEPLQERSRATRDRILHALAGLLETGTFDQVSVAELTARAQCSMSSFYARFPTKDALLNAFYDRFFEVSALQMRAALSRIHAAGPVPADRIHMLIEFIVRAYRGHRGLLRSLILHSRTHPDAGFGERTRTYKRQVSTELLAVIRDDAGRPLDRAGRTSTAFALWLVIQAVEQVILFDDPVVGAGRMSERRLVEELTTTLRQAVEGSTSGRKARRPGDGASRAKER